LGIATDKGLHAIKGGEQPIELLSQEKNWEPPTKNALQKKVMAQRETCALQKVKGKVQKKKKKMKSRRLDDDGGGKRYTDKEG